MKEIRLLHIDANQTLEIVRELRARGLVQGVDFNFSVYPAKFDIEAPWEAVSPKQTGFRFYDDKLATMFILKYGSSEWQ